MKNSKIRVLHIIDEFGVRTETFIYNYVSSMVKTKPIILTGKYSNRNDFPFHGKIYFVPTNQNRWSWLWFKNNIYKLTIGNSWRLKQIEKCMDEIKPHIIHAHFGPNGYDMIPIKEKYKIHLITSFYGYDMSSLPKNRRVRKKYTELFKYGDIFLTEGPHMREKLIELGAPEQKVRIQRIAINIDKYPAWEPSIEKNIILFVGRFVEKKGLIYALEAINILIKEGYVLEFNIIGGGPLYKNIKKFIDKNQIGEYVNILGMKPHDMVINEIKKAHVFIHPSVTSSTGETEGGAPTVLLEAQAIGTPIVTTFHADIPNIVPNDPGIILTEEKNIDALVNAIKTLLKRKSRVSNSYVKKHHDIHNEVIILEKVYEELVNNKNGGNSYNTTARFNTNIK